MTDLSPSARRIAKPGWLDLRLVFGVVLVLAAVLLGAVVFARADHRAPVLTTTRDLSAGTILHADDLTVARVQLPGDGRALYLTDLTDAVGRQLQRPLAAGELLPSAALTTVPARTTVTIPFAAGNAPDLRAGQRLEIWVSTPACASVVVLPDVTVQDVHADTGGSFSTGTGGQDVVVSVAPALADRVVGALALDQAQIRAGVLVGDAARHAAPPASTGAAGGLPPDLARCAGGTGSR